MHTCIDALLMRIALLALNVLRSGEQAISGDEDGRGLSKDAEETVSIQSDDFS